MKISGFALTAVLMLVTLTACGSGSSSSSSSWPTSSQYVSAAYVQSVAFRNHTTMAWGNNGYGQLGNSNSGNSLTPVPVSGIPRVDGVVTGGTHSLAWNPIAVWAWGNNGYGQLGNGTVTASYVPVRVFKNNTSAHNYLNNVTAVSAGGNHSLALDTGGTVWAWGANTWGQAGGVDPLVLAYSMVALPVQNPIVGGAIASTKIAAGGGHSLALDISGSVWAWGYNYAGQLGDTTTVNKFVPVQVVTGSGPGILQNVVAIAAGGSHSLALLADKTLVSWGYNNYGQLGCNSVVSSSVPTPVVDSSGVALSGVIAIAAGLDHSLALKEDKTVWAWGYNSFGQLGTGSTIDRHVAVQVPGLAAIDAISAVGHHSLAFSGSKSWAWGDNSYGQVGVNSTATVLSPMPVSGYR